MIQGERHLLIDVLAVPSFDSCSCYSIRARAIRFVLLLVRFVLFRRQMRCGKCATVKCLLHLTVHHTCIVRCCSCSHHESFIPPTGVLISEQCNLHPRWICLDVQGMSNLPLVLTTVGKSLLACTVQGQAVS